ncbi:uncharacterized protein IL334_003761 [Kwoniella shivajii]|uniref:Uncharacterized protein n=1 Tax=Kwoniella shivajii TaxID=564305 RepID=A0ABZ1CYG2_9TREE|nr:hypothetical protein IL334_003761 [Kwoniella shivajii]
MSPTNSPSSSRKNPNLHIDLTSSSTDPSPNRSYLSSPVSQFRARSPSRSGDNIPSSADFGPPSPSNPYSYQYLRPSAASDIVGKRRWIRRIMKRNFVPTPLGYAVLLLLVIALLYIINPISEDTSLPSHGTPPNGYHEVSSEDHVGGIEVDEELEIDNPALPSLPTIFSDLVPSLTLPSELLTPHLYPLAKRISNFLHRPVLSHDEAKERNYKGCPREISDKLVNPDQYNGDSQFWMEDVTEEEIVRRRIDVLRWLKDRIDRGEEILGKEGKTGVGRGIVLTGGNQDTTLRTITALKHLRRLKVDLPIEVFHYSDELTDQGQRSEIEALGATLREARGLDKVDGVWKSAYQSLPRVVN